MRSLKSFEPGGHAGHRRVPSPTRRAGRCRRAARSSAALGRRRPCRRRASGCRPSATRACPGDIGVVGDSPHVRRVRRPASARAIVGAVTSSASTTTVGRDLAAGERGLHAVVGLHDRQVARQVVDARVRGLHAERRDRQARRAAAVASDGGDQRALAAPRSSTAFHTRDSPSLRRRRCRNGMRPLSTFVAERGEHRRAGR